MRILGRDPKPPAALVDLLDLPRGEKVLAFAVDDNTGATVVATTTELLTVVDGQVRTRRPWSDVDTGGWSPDTWTLSITWVGGGQGSQYTFKEVETRMPEVFHERVRASVVISGALPTTGRAQSGHVAIRKNLRTGEIFDQVVLGRRTNANDPEVAAQIAHLKIFLRDQVGLPPVAD